MDSIVLLTRHPVAQTVFAIAGLAFGIVIARKFLRSKKVHQRTSILWGSHKHPSMSEIDSMTMSAPGPE